MVTVKKYLSEFLGTFVLVLFACVSQPLRLQRRINAAYVLTALAFGGVIVAMAYSIGHIPAATSIRRSDCSLAEQRMNTKDFIGYVVSQFLGAIAGAASCWP